MSRVHDALRRAEMGGMMPAEEPPEVPAEAVQVSPDLRPPEGVVNGSASPPPHRPVAPQYTPRHAQRGPRGALLAGPGIAPAGSQQLARNTGRGVPHAAHPAQSPAEIGRAHVFQSL